MTGGTYDLKDFGVPFIVLGSVRVGQHGTRVWGNCLIEYKKAGMACIAESWVITSRAGAVLDVFDGLSVNVIMKAMHFSFFFHWIFGLYPTMVMLIINPISFGPDK